MPAETHTDTATQELTRSARLERLLMSSSLDAMKDPHMVVIRPNQ
jgi:hypothetical protein